MRVLSEGTHTAKKEHPCNACEWLIEYGLSSLKELNLTLSEYRAIAKAKSNGWKIKKGERYFKQAQIFEGDFCVFKAIPEINDICTKHNIYPNPYY